MICQPCQDAADARAPRDAHCHDPACMCGHRTDRYQPAPEQCRAEYREPSWPLGRCDQPAGHTGNHVDSTIPGLYQWHDDRATYPTTQEA